jgi:hypothetical protein
VEKKKQELTTTHTAGEETGDEEAAYNRNRELRSLGSVSIHFFSLFTIQ